MALTPHGASVQIPVGQDAGSVRAFLLKLEQAVQSGNPDDYLALLTDTADRRRAGEFAETEVRRGATRVVLLERDREPTISTAGPGLRLFLDAFVDAGARGRVATWQLDLRRTATNEWRVADQERLSGVDNLYRLFLNPNRQFAARAFTIHSEDLELTLDDGAVFTVDTDQGITALVLLGRGTMRFHPAPPVEKRQIEIFAGAEALQSRFEAAYVRVGDLASHADVSKLVERPVDLRTFQRADAVFREESSKSFAFDLSDFTPTAWTLLPAFPDLLAEVRTRRFGTLTYSKSAAASEDISLFDRSRQKNIAVYRSVDRLASRGRFSTEEDPGDFDVRNYDIDVSFDPVRQWLEGRATVRLTIGSTATSQIALHLAPSLAVRSVTSQQFGRLFCVRVRNQDTLLVTLPALMLPGADIDLTIAYSGGLSSEPADWELLGRIVDAGQDFPDPRPIFPRLEPRFLYSSRSYWYPRPSISDYATASLRITVPATFDCLASGDPAADSPTMINDPDPSQRRERFVFTAARPLRYLSFFVTRLTAVDRATVTFGGDGAGGVAETQSPTLGPDGYSTLSLSILSHARLTSSARDLTPRTASMTRFYESLVGDSPYASLSFALIEGPQPGGHSPGYFAVLSQPPLSQPRTWRNDPAAFDRYPDFFPAHEIAHQWWGQAVGWNTYHDQWLSEGFAQYFAALYVEHQRGEPLFRSIVGDMRKWAMRDSNQGPIYLGYRLGHVRDDPRIFRALVYDKGAMVLHMLRRFIGDEAFFGGIRRFYADWRFRKAGSEDFRRAMEAESGRSLERFFDRWVYGWSLPQLTFSYRVENDPATAGGRTIVLRVDQIGDLFDVPVNVQLEYVSKPAVDVILQVSDRTTEQRVPLAAGFRRATIREDGTLAEVRQN
jgi:hypothetical protein